MDIDVSNSGDPAHYSGQLFSSCDPNIDTYLANELGAGNRNWPAVNYVLNHKGSYSTSVLQGAIWYFMGTPDTDPASPTTSVNNPLVAQTLADLNNWIADGHPKCPDVVGAVMLFDGYPNDFGLVDVQMLLMEVPCTCCTGQIGDFVWNDLNSNGCQDAGEPGIPGVTVDLYTGCASGGTPVFKATTTTDANGKYLFSGLCAGDYTVRFHTPAGYVHTLALQKCNVGGLPPTETDSNCQCTGADDCDVCVTLATDNTQDLSIDCGYVTLPSATCFGITALQNVAITPVTMVGSGGCGGPYTFSASGLPAGLTMSSGGTISGTPTVTGTVNYTVTVTDNCGNQGTVNCTVTVLPPVSANCVTISAVQNVAITPVTMVGSGGCGGPYTFSATGLPAGVTMSSSGTISGTPSVSGTVNYTVTVTDKCGNTGTVNCSVTVKPPPSASCVTITAVQGTAITPVTLVGSGGCGGPYTFSATGLPTGLTMSTGGTISGTPTVNGTFNYTVTITDNCGNKGTLNCSVTVKPPPSASCVTITAVQGTAITPVTMVGSGGCGGPYTFSATGLPAGLTMSSGGTISGTPTVSGTFPYTVTITDKCGNKGTVNCSVTVNRPPMANCVTITPVQDVAITPVTLVGSGGCGGPYTFSATGLPAGLTMSSGGTISGTPTVSGTFPYTVTITDKCGNKGTVNCSVTVCGSSICGTVYADCDGSGDLSGGDVGYKGVVVTLKNAQGRVVVTVTTDANGNYCFYNLPAGSYTVSIVQPSNCKQTAGTTTHHWKDNYGRTCWKDNDNYVHWKDSNNTDCWNANDGYMHWKDGYGRDCWKDRYGNNHWQNCNYVSCDARVDNTECVTLGQCEAKGDVDFAYMGTTPKTQVCVTGPSRAKCGDTIRYTCKVSNVGNVCFTGGCKVYVCGQWFTCPNLSPGQDWTCTKDYKVQWGDFGTLNCHVTATCYPAGGGNVSNDSTCSTQVGWQ